MKNIKFYLLLVCPFLFLVSACKTKDADDTPPKQEDPTAHYEFNFTLTYPNFDNPDTQETTKYTFEYKNGGLSEKVRKVSSNPVRLKGYSDTPVSVTMVADMEIIDKSQLFDKIPNLTLGRSATSGNIQLLDENLRGLPNQNRIEMNSVPAIPYHLIKRIHILTEHDPTSAISRNETLEIAINDGSNSLGIARIEVITEVEDISFDVTVGIKKTLNQIAEDFRFEAISTINAINKFFGFEHVVGGDGCPMPLFEVKGVLNNSLPSEILQGLCYTYSGLKEVDAYNIKYPENSLFREVEIDQQVYDCHRLNDQNEFHAIFEFNCARAADVAAQPQLNVFFSGPGPQDMGHFPVQSVFEFETNMR